ncbi:MAG: peptidoglycan-associated lipoprotein Pal [Desulfuromonadales bacterium]|nr:peptidoglycan-associated lipoprotein Pal [Desulfuromonadales bacterium]MDH3959771.1 peptidoglycan-associated lipoprotein Pal [Desulfuromonadales bacterium]MDH4024248.1 peptidoglycan-associated lipoprotein Pal [Desulfuromonadales bacterium]
MLLLTVVTLLCVVVIAGCAKDLVVETIDAEAQNEAVQKKQASQNVDDADILDKTTVINVGLERVYFPFDQFALTNEARRVLDANAIILKSYPALKVSIEGHCDSRGSDEYNLALGERRAHVVKNYLVSLGIGSDRFETISYGEELPADSAMTESAWAMNRRTEFKTINQTFFNNDIAPIDKSQIDLVTKSHGS